MNEKAETTQTKEIEVSVEPVAEATTLTNTQKETLVQSVEPAVSTSKDSKTTGIEFVDTENTDLLVAKETKTMEIVEKKDNKNPTFFQKQNLICGIAILVVFVFLVLVAKRLIAKHRASESTEKVTKKDKDFLKLIYHLNHVYTKTDNYLKQKS